MKGRMLVVVALVGATAALAAGPAGAVPVGKLDAQVLGNVRIDASDPTVAYITARYICEGGDGAHVWASVKQAESRLPESWLRLEGSGEASAAWSHSHRDAVTCDGQWHVDTFTVDQLEWGQGTLQAGQAWVQFCVIPPGQEPGPGAEVITWSMRFAAIS